MKRFCIWMLIILQLFLLPACQTEITAPPQAASGVTTTTVETKSDVLSTASDIESSTEPITGDSTILSPVRYTIDYEITDIFEKYPEIQRTPLLFYTKNEQLYINSVTLTDQGYQHHLTVLDAHGVPTEYPLPAFTENGIFPRYIYPLENGKFVMIYSPMSVKIDSSMNSEQIYSLVNSVQKADRYLAIANADGSFERYVYLTTDNRNAETSIYVFEEPSDTDEDSGELYIITRKNNEERVCFNQYLEETPLDNDPYKGRILKYLGNQRFLYGSFCSGLRSFQLGNEETKPYAMHTPSEWEYASVHTDTDGDFYIWDDNGIYLYREDEQPIKIVDVNDSGLARTNDGMTSIYILNDEAVYKFNDNTNQLMLYNMLKIPVEDTRQTIRIDVMGLHQTVKDWLYDGVALFNDQNNEYKIDINMINDVGGVDLREYYRDVIDEMLLYGNHPDMLITDQVSVLASYYEKNAFLDMEDRIEHRLLGCASGIDGDDSTLYQIPFGMQLTTFAAPSTYVPQRLTYKDFLSQLQQLHDDQYITSFIPMVFYDIYSDFIDANTKTSNFDSDEFRDVILAMHKLQTENERYINSFAGDLSFGERMVNTGTGGSLNSFTRYGQENQYWTMNGTVGTALENGDLKFLSVTFNDMRAFSALKLIFGDTDFSLCGYPSLAGGGASITSGISAAILWDTEYAEGCAAFLNFLLSDSMQSQMASSCGVLPVTYQSMSTMIDQYRYSLYDETTADAMHNRNTPGYVALEPQEISETWLPGFDDLTAEEQKRRIIEITDEDKQMLLRFFDEVRPRKQTASVIQSIITEELSYWENNARSLEETTKIIDSRVWICLNE